MRYEFIAGNLALDFANTVHNHGAAEPENDLKAIPDLVEWARQAGLLTGVEIRLPRGQAQKKQFDRALALREALYAIFNSAAHGKKPASAALNEFQAFHDAAIRNAEFRSSGDRYELAWTTGDSLEHVLREIVRSAAGLLTSGALTRVRQCSGEDCSWLFLDTSRNGLRRWCDMKACGNRAKVRRFRSIQRKGENTHAAGRL